MGKAGNFTAARKKKKLTISELASLVGVSEACISRYETGVRQMPVSMAKKIAEILKVRWWELYD